MLGQGCLRAFFGEQFISTSSGFKMGSCQYSGMGPKVGEKCFLCKSGSNASKPTFYSLWTHFGTLEEKNQLTFRGGNCSLKGPWRSPDPAQDKTLAMARHFSEGVVRWVSTHESAHENVHKNALNVEFSLSIPREGLQFPNVVVLNAVGRRDTQKSANARKIMQTRVRKRAQKSAKGRKS